MTAAATMVRVYGLPGGYGGPGRGAGPGPGSGSGHGGGPPGAQWRRQDHHPAAHLRAAAAGVAKAIFLQLTAKLPVRDMP